MRAATSAQPRFKVIRPVREHFMKGASWGQVLVAVVVWAVLLSLSVFVSVIIALVWPNRLNWPPVFLPVMGLILVAHLSGPLIGGGFTALFVRSAVDPETLNLLQLTDVRPTSIVWGSFVGAIYKLRFVPAILWSVSMAPFLVLWLSTFRNLTLLINALFFAVPLASLMLFSFIVLWVGPFIASVAVGVGIGLRTRGSVTEFGAVVSLIFLFVAWVGILATTLFWWLLLLFPQVCIAAILGYFLLAGIFLVVAEQWVFLNGPLQPPA